jgi:hypothetical protein
MSEVRPIHVPGSSAMSVVLQRTRAALTAWARAWVSGFDEQRFAVLNIESAREADLRPSREFEGMHGANGHAWFRRGALDRSNFGHAVVGAELMPRFVYADDWIAGIADHAWMARNRALCEALVGAPRTTQPACSSEWPASLSSVGSGAVTVSCDSLGLHVIADAGVWSLVPPAERKSARLPTLVPLDRAAQRANLHIEVMLGSVELELPKITDLRCGDVLRLPTRLDQPLTVSCEGKPFARAMLGDAAGRKSVLITNKNQ